MNTADKKVSLFIDTNIFQSFIGTDKVFLQSIGVSKDYYTIVDFINKYRLSDKIEICIPSVVVMECKQHMKKCFREQCKEIEKVIQEEQKIFGSLIELSANIKVSEDEFSAYIDSLFSSFFDLPRNQCKMVHYDENAGIFESLLTKALTGTKPFYTGKVGNKQYSDAGFKDSVIAETIYHYCEQEGRIGILLSKDGDFANAFERRLSPDSQYVQYMSIPDAIDGLSDFYGTKPEDRLRREFLENSYWTELLLNEVSMEYDESVTKRQVKDIKEIDEGIYNIIFNVTVNEAIYHFSIRFDSIGNEIIDFQYQIGND